MRSENGQRRTGLQRIMKGMEETLVLRVERIKTPIGTMLIAADKEGVLRALSFEDHEGRMLEELRRLYACGVTLRPTSRASLARGALERYFAGDLRAIDALPVASAGTPFQRRVWHALRAIPLGTTTTYGDLAKKIGRPAAVRAVGAANGANPIPIVVPCHRVIGSAGKLTGYGGGIERKRWLLRHEGVLLA
jgi:methylated-DNA-[protein]-cysteine S-methyltransferase